MVDYLAAASEEQKPSAFLGALAVRQIEVGMASFMASLFGTALALLSQSNPTEAAWIAASVGPCFCNAYSGDRFRLV